MASILSWLVISTAVLFAPECSSEIRPSTFLPWSLGSCLRPNIVDTLDATRYFAGTWYEQRNLGNIFFQGLGRCLGFTSRIGSWGEVLTYHFVYDDILNQYIGVRGSVKPVPSTGNFHMEFSIAPGISIHLPIHVIDTDYDSYAVVYSCRQALFMKSEIAWVLLRARGDTSKDGIINEVLHQAGLDVNNFRRTRDVNCPPGEPLP